MLLFLLTHWLLNIYLFYILFSFFILDIMNTKVNEFESPENFVHHRRIFTCQEHEKGILDMLLRTHPDIWIVFSDNPSSSLEQKWGIWNIKYDNNHPSFKRDISIRKEDEQSSVTIKEIESLLLNASSHSKNRCYINGVFFPKSVVEEILKLSEEKKYKALERIQETIWNNSWYLHWIISNAFRWKNIIESNDTNILFLGSPESISVIRIAHIFCSRNIDNEKIRDIFAWKKGFPVALQRSVLREIIFPQKTDFRELAIESSDKSSKTEQQLKHILWWIVGSKNRIITDLEKKKIEDYLSNNKNHNSPFYNEIQEMYDYYQKRQIWKIIRYVKSKYELIEGSSQWLRSNNNWHQKRILWWDPSLSNINPRLIHWFREHVYEILRFEKDWNRETWGVITIEDIENYDNRSTVEEITNWMQWGLLYPMMLVDYCSANQVRTLKGDFELGESEIQEIFHIDAIFQWEQENFGIQVYTGPTHKTHSIEASREKLWRKQVNIYEAQKRNEAYKVFDEHWEITQEIPLSQIPHKLLLVHVPMDQEERDELEIYFDKYNIWWEKHIFSGWDKDKTAIHTQHIGKALNTILKIFSQNDDVKTKREVEKLITGKVRNLVAQTNKYWWLTIQVIDPSSKFMIWEITLYFDISKYTTKTAKTSKNKITEAERERRKKQKQKRKERRKKWKFPWRLQNYS